METKKDTELTKQLIELGVVYFTIGGHSSQHLDGSWYVTYQTAKNEHDEKFCSVSVQSLEEIIPAIRAQIFA